MSRGHGRLLGRSSSLIPQYGGDYGLDAGRFWKAKLYKERADFYAC